MFEEFAFRVSEWASTVPTIKRAYIFGSRAKGCHKFDSDLDVAIALDGDDEGFVDWIHDGRDMEVDLQLRLPVKVDLQMMHSNDSIVMPSVREHGILVYERDHR